MNKEVNVEIVTLKCKISTAKPQDPQWKGTQSPTRVAKDYGETQSIKSSGCSANTQSLHPHGVLCGYVRAHTFLLEATLLRLEHQESEIASGQYCCDSLLD